MRIEGHHRQWEARDESSLERVLRLRDLVGGAQFFLSHADSRYPALAIRVSGHIADVHYFPFEGHPGFRALATPGGSSSGVRMVYLVYEGCDPSTGEETPIDYALPAEVALSLAMEFYRKQEMPAGASWLEL